MTVLPSLPIARHAEGAHQIAHLGVCERTEVCAKMHTPLPDAIV